MTQTQELLGGAVGDGYYKVPIHLYREGDLIEEDLYILYQGDHILFRPQNLIWKRDDTKKLEEFNIECLFIRFKDEKGHYSFLENNLSRLLKEENIPHREKAKIVYATSSAIIEDIFQKPQSHENVRRSVSFVKNSIDYLSQNKSNFFQLMELATRNFSEYTHAIQVSAYAVTLAKQVGYKNFNDLSAVGVGSILHDIGKSKIPLKLLNKPEHLNDEERREINRHPQFGYEIVHKQRTIPELAETIILQHHERPNGRGYPYALSEEIFIFSKIVAISDCFDGLTSDRPYKKALSSFDAIEYMRTTLKEEYDQKLLFEFIKMLKN